MDIGQVERVDINKEMRSAYLDYAMSVIVSRALPDARDGLKPVHRRILYAMHDMGIRANSSYKKSARIVGEVLGKYHPHSDTAVYDAMARMAQDFSMRYPLVDGQGNFGSIGGDPPAAMRYTEARMDRLSGELLTDIDKGTVDFLDNFDASLQEPGVLPSRLPNLLLNGSSGIAVGMACNIPPHNFNELAGALDFMIGHYIWLYEKLEKIGSEELGKIKLGEWVKMGLEKVLERVSEVGSDQLRDIESEALGEDAGEKWEEIGLDNLLEYINGPDFPTGGIIVGVDDLRQMYTHGRGRLILRGRAEIQPEKRRIVITEIPYQINLTNLIERIADLARSRRIDGIADLRDESNRNGLRIVVELRRNAYPKTVLNQLYKFTPLQTTFGAQILALVKGEPVMLSLRKALQIFVAHRVEVIVRRTEFDLAKAKARAHVLEGLMIALANLDDVIQTIRQSDDVDDARQKLMSRFKLSEIQAQAILDMQLRRLAALERQKIEDEYKQVKELIEFLQDLLDNPKKVLAVIREDIQELVEKYGDERRTTVDPTGSADIDPSTLYENIAVLISITERGYIKRVPATKFRAQRRGGKGVKGHATKEEDEVMLLLPARNRETILFFTDRGKVYSVPAYEIREADRTAKGTSIFNVLNMSPDETVTAAVRVSDFKKSDYCIMATRKGRTKRVKLSEFASVRPSGLIAIRLDDDDELGWVRLTTGQDDVIFITEMGQALRIKEDAVRSMGRQAAGVISIRMRGDDRMTSMEVVEEGGDLLVVTTHGIGKRTPLGEYSPKGRATYGVKTINTNAIGSIGKIASARVVQKEDHLTMISTNGVVLRTKVKNISQGGRATRGVILMDLGKEDTVASVARIAAADLKKVGVDSEDIVENGEGEIKKVD